jgi:alginate O-acetyltransferase complex protein AlgI
MLFNSLVFFVFLLPTLLLYWLVSRQQVRLWVLLAASLIFYGWHHWPSVFLLVFTILFNFAVGRVQNRLHSRPLLWGAISANLSLLLWFKYAAFVAQNVNALAALVGLHFTVPVPPIFLPLGISFFTFQVVAYQVDVYRREIEAEDSLSRFAVFKCFFPQLIAGPIVRAKDFLPQLRERALLDPAAFHQGLWLLLAGLALKIGVADVLAQFADEAFRAPAALSTSGAWAGLYAYAFQLYADFWGYSTMAVGLAAMFGLVLPLNFDTPYASASLQEFWRRWHITLSVWFRDYVYIPLGGNRGSQARNLILTMGLAGLWHGAGWPFIIWGLAHGVWLAAERHLPTLPASLRWLKTALVFHGVCLLWVLFRAPDLHVAGQYYARLLLPHGEGEPVALVLIAWLSAFALIQWPVAWTFPQARFTRLSLPAQWGLGLLCLAVILAYAGARVDFIYFNF